jgi:hypothetical protein
MRSIKHRRIAGTLTRPIPVNDLSDIGLLTMVDVPRLIHFIRSHNLLLDCDDTVEA